MSVSGGQQSVPRHRLAMKKVIYTERLVLIISTTAESGLDKRLSSATDLYRPATR